MRWLGSISSTHTQTRLCGRQPPRSSLRARTCPNIPSPPSVRRFRCAQIPGQPALQQACLLGPRSREGCECPPAPQGFHGAGEGLPVRLVKGLIFFFWGRVSPDWFWGVASPVRFQPTMLRTSLLLRSARGACRARYAHTQASGLADGQALSIQKMSINEWSDAFKKVPSVALCARQGYG